MTTYKTRRRRSLVPVALALAGLVTAALCGLAFLQAVLHASMAWLLLMAGAAVVTGTLLIAASILASAWDSGPRPPRVVHRSARPPGR